MSDAYLFKHDSELENDLIALYKSYGKTKEGKAFYCKHLPLEHIWFCINHPDSGIASYDEKTGVTISMTAVLMFGCANIWPVPVFLFTFMTMSMLNYRDRNQSDEKKASHSSDRELGQVLNSWSQFLHDVAMGSDGPDKNRILHVLDKLRDMFYNTGVMFYESPDAMATFIDSQRIKPEIVPGPEKNERVSCVTNGIEFVIGDTNDEKRKRINPS